MAISPMNGNECVNFLSLGAIIGAHVPVTESHRLDAFSRSTTAQTVVCCFVLVFDVAVLIETMIG